MTSQRNGTDDDLADLPDWYRKAKVLRDLWVREGDAPSWRFRLFVHDREQNIVLSYVEELGADPLHMILDRWRFQLLYRIMVHGKEACDELPVGSVR